MPKYAYALEHADKDYQLASPGRDWILQHRGVEFCEYCSKVKRSLYPRPIDIILNMSGYEFSIGRQNSLCIGVISMRLKNALAPWLGNFVFGQCRDVSGSITPNYQTFYSNRYVVPIARDIDRFVCHLCGTATAHWGEPPRLLRADFTNPIMEEATDLLYVSEEVYTSVKWSSFADIDLVECELI